MEMSRSWGLKLTSTFKSEAVFPGPPVRKTMLHSGWKLPILITRPKEMVLVDGRLHGSLPRSLTSYRQERYFHSLLGEVKMGTAVLERNSTVHIRNLWWLNVWASYTISGNLTSQNRLRHTSAQCPDADTATAVPLTTAPKENKTKTKLET